MCDWPVYDSYHRIDSGRRCDNNGIHDVGPLAVCPRHLSILVTGVLAATRRHARQLAEDGRATPGGIESEMRFVLAEIDKERRGQRYVSEGRPPCVYFAEREGYVKIGTTINLALRMQSLAAGGAMLLGMTAGPLNLLATIPGDIDTEKALHKRFRRLRVDPKREWFRYEGKLREYVESLQLAP